MQDAARSGAPIRDGDKLRRVGASLSNLWAIFIQNPREREEGDRNKAEEAGGPSDTHGTIPAQSRICQ